MTYTPTVVVSKLEIGFPIKESVSCNGVGTGFRDKNLLLVSWLFHLFLDLVNEFYLIFVSFIFLPYNMSQKVLL